MRVLDKQNYVLNPKNIDDIGKNCMADLELMVYKMEKADKANGKKKYRPMIKSMILAHKELSKVRKLAGKL